MEKAKAAIGNFISKDGKRDTTVHETVSPAVQNEYVTRTQNEEVTKAVDREVHQDHYHTSVQPIQDREVLPEEHQQRQLDVEERRIKHGDDSHVQERLAAEQAQFKNTRSVGETQYSSTAQPTVVGEHVHHHVHENIQPVIEKETIQPSVVHTIKPVHEVHQNEAKHHTATALPAVTMDEFSRQGGSLTGREERVDSFGGEPRAVGGTLGGPGAEGTTSLTENESMGNNRSGLTGNNNSGMTGNSADSGVDSAESTTRKPSLMDRLNPRKDADGDGKAGFMK